MEVGFVTLEINELNLTLKTAPVKDLQVRMDVEITNGLGVFRWISVENTKFSSTIFKPVLKDTMESGTGYVVGFDELSLRTNFIDLNSEVMNGLSNSVVSLRLFSINESVEPVVTTKPVKGSAPAVVIPAEELLLEMQIPLCIILQNDNSNLSISESIDFFKLSEFNVSYSHPNVGTESTLSFAISTDNCMAEYVLGAKYLQWTGAVMRHTPVAWGLHAIDVIDPKAKIQPTVSDLRTKYIDNIVRVVSSQSKLSSFSLSVGFSDPSDTLPETVGTIQQLLPSGVFPGGVLSFNQELAQQISLEEDIRARSDLWTLSWGSSAVTFLHRSDVRRLLTAVKQDSSGAYLSVTVRKTPTTEGIATEGGELFATGLVNFSSLFSPEVKSVNIQVALQGSDFEEAGTTQFIMSLSSNSAFVSRSRLQSLAEKNTAVANQKGLSVEVLDHQQVTSLTSNTDALEQLRDEIKLTIERVAQEYVSLYPFANLGSNTDSKSEDSAAAVAAQQKNREMRKVEFLNYLSSNGIFHELKERLKTSVQQIIRDRYGARNRALGQDTDLLSGDTIPPEGRAETVLSELYVFLMRECSVVLNSLFSDTLIDRQAAELQASSLVDDEQETVIQHLRRISSQADDSAADGRFETSEALHLECIQYVDSIACLGSDSLIVYNVYSRYGEFLLHYAAAVMNEHDRLAIIKRAREALSIAVNANASAWETGLLFAAVLVECGQQEQGEAVLHQVFSVQLNAAIPARKDGQESLNLTSFDDFDGYDSDQLCPVDPRCYCLLAGLFSLQGSALKCRKALRLSVRSFAEGDFKPHVSTHGSPPRTVVLTLAQTAHFLLLNSLFVLGAECARLALSSEDAVAAKALSKNKIAVTVPHIKHMLKLVQAVVQQIEVSVDDLTNSESKAELLALESTQVATDVKDKILGWLCAAKIHLNNSAKVDASKAVEYHLNALELLDSLPFETQKSGLMKISDFLQLGKLLIGMGRHKEALSSLLKGCALFTTASLFLLVGVCFMRLEQTQNAEEALMAANVLDNRNPDIWAYLCLHSLSFGKSRLNEADKSLQQALRLGLTNVSLFRELTTAYIAIDKLQVAEDLVRRALSQESKDFHLTGRRQSSHTRRLLGDVLAGQNQAVQAIEAYQAVIAVDDDLTSAGRVHKLEAAEKCAALLSSIGRDEELRTLRVIIASLRD